MTIYRVRFPYEVNEETGSSEMLYPTLKEAKRVARDDMQRTVSGRSIHLRYCVEGGFLTATIEKVQVCKIDRTTLCEIINETGGYQTACWPAGEIKVRCPQQAIDEAIAKGERAY